MSSHFFLEDRQLLGDNSVAVPIALALLPAFPTSPGDFRQISREANIQLAVAINGDLTPLPDHPGPRAAVKVAGTRETASPFDNHALARWDAAATQAPQGSGGELRSPFSNPLRLEDWQSLAQTAAVAQPLAGMTDLPAGAGTVVGTGVGRSGGAARSGRADTFANAGPPGQTSQLPAPTGGSLATPFRHSTHPLKPAQRVGAPGQGQAGPVRQAGPFIGPYVVATFGINGTGSIPINADDDNGSAILKGVNGDPKGIPSKRDFDVSPIMNGGKGDPDLMPETIVIGGYPTNGTFSVSLSPANNNSGNVNLWWEATKTTALPASWSYDPNRLLFYIEGIKASQAANDLTLILSYTYTDSFNQQQTIQTIEQLTVVPVVSSFTLTPAAGQNVFFHNSTDVTGGLQSYSPTNPVVAIEFDADLIVGPSLRGNGAFVQDKTAVNNGANGTTIKVNNVDTRVGWLYDGKNKGASEALVVPPAPKPPYTIPLLDAMAGQITYVTKDHQNSILSNGLEWVYDDDNPNKIPAPMPGAKDTIDVEWKFTTWLVYTWDQPVGLVIYALEYSTWQVDWYATGGSVNTLHGLTSSGVYVVSNANPGCTDPYNLANGGTTWVNVP